MFEDGEDDGDDGVEDGGLQGTNLEIITLQQSDIQVQGGPKKRSLTIEAMEGNRGTVNYSAKITYMDSSSGQVV